jgi:hypothetical protein
MEGRKDKKPTKKELQAIVDSLITDEAKEEIILDHKAELKKAHIKGLCQGYELSNRMLLEWAENHTIEEVVDFCRKNVKNKGKMESVVSGVKVVDNIEEV